VLQNRKQNPMLQGKDTRIISEIKDFFTTSEKAMYKKLQEILAARGVPESQSNSFLNYLGADPNYEIRNRTRNAAIAFWWLDVAAANNFKDAIQTKREFERVQASGRFRDAMAISIVAQQEFYEKGDYEMAYYWSRMAGVKGDHYSYYRAAKIAHDGLINGKSSYVYENLKKSLLDDQQYTRQYIYEQYYRLGLVCLTGGYGAPQNYKEAVEWFKKALNTGKDIEDIFLGLAKAYLMLGDIKAARKYYDKSKKCKRGFTDEMKFSEKNN
jgi:tetratricopeptide (TPR) repeat protein